MTVVEQLTSLRRRKRRPARLVSERTGIASSNIYAIERGRRDPSTATLERLADGVGARLFVVDTEGHSPVSETVARIRRRVEGGQSHNAYRHLIQISDDLAGAPADVACFIAYAAPPSIDAGWDAAIAGVVEYRLAQRGLPLPEWLADHGRTAGPDWGPSRAPYPIDAADVPEPLLRRGVWIEADELTSA
ncbi:MAG: helix-turn-helix domain-containing protein [Microbacterium sp.]